jgi:hypothetical protein
MINKANRENKSFFTVLQGPGIKPYFLWCRCICGKYCDVEYRRLWKEGASCRCRKKETNRRTKEKSGEIWLKVGYRHRSLEIVEVLPRQRYRCRCSCERKTELVLNHSAFRATKRPIKCCVYCLSPKERPVMNGDVFGLWTVVDDNDGKGRDVLCLCKCGALSLVKKYSLKSGDSTSCGCNFKSRLMENKQQAGETDMVIGAEFYGWTVVGLSHKKNHILAQCHCGRPPVHRVAQALREGKTKSCDCKKTEHTKETLLERYGTTNPFILPEIREKTAKTMEERYGKEAARQLVSSISNPERELVTWLHGLGLEVETFFQVGGFRTDAYVRSHGIAIEHNGFRWHSETAIEKRLSNRPHTEADVRRYHYDRRVMYKMIGVDMIQIWESEWKYRKEQVKAHILRALRMTERISPKDLTVLPCSFEVATRFVEEFSITKPNEIPTVVWGVFRSDLLVAVWGETNDAAPGRMLWGPFIRSGVTPDDLCGLILRQYRPDQRVRIAVDLAKNGIEALTSAGWQIVENIPPKPFWFRNKKFSKEQTPKAERGWDAGWVLLEGVGTKVPETFLPPTQSDGTCHQYLRRVDTLDEDVAAGKPIGLRASEFELAQEPLSREHRDFIQRYEWLGNMGWNVKWVFTARYKGDLAGVVAISEPTAFSGFGRTHGTHLEALVQRGACAAWAPKNLNSRLVMFACRWMVQHTDKRCFVAYSDPRAGEIGTIYQACNWDYLGDSFGNSVLYVLPSGKMVGARYFTRTSSMQRWARELGIEWLPEWSKPNGYQNVRAYPPEVKKRLLDHAKLKMSECPQREVERKGKYVLLLGRDRRDQKRLDKMKTWSPKPYPKRNGVPVPTK